MMDMEDFCFPLEEDYKGVANDPKYKGIPSKVYQVILYNGIETAEELATIHPINFMMMKGLGPKSIDWIEDRLVECGLLSFENPLERIL